MLGAAVRVNNTSSACPNVPWNMPDKRPCAPFTGDRGMLPSAGASERASSKTIDNNASSTQIPPKLKELSPVVRMQAPPCAIARVASEQLTGLVCRNHRIARTRNTCAVLQWMTRRLRGRVGRYIKMFRLLFCVPGPGPASAPTTVEQHVAMLEHILTCTRDSSGRRS